MKVINLFCITSIVFSSVLSSVSAHDHEVKKTISKSSQIMVGDNSLHVNYVAAANGVANDKPAVILLSGPNKHWHSDSAWFALTQSHLARSYRSYAIDRAGQGFSSANGELSYSAFADNLSDVLIKLNEKHVILVGFASANIPLALFHQKYASNFDIQGMLLIDPDILTAETVAFYQDYPASWYQQNIDKIVEHIKLGKWTERSQLKNQTEVEEIKKMIPSKFLPLMNWSYFNHIADARLTISGQISRAKSIAVYGNDLNKVVNLPMITDTKVSVINSDFEVADLPEKADEIAKIKRWQQLGDSWSKKIANASGGQYIHLPSTSHLVMFEQPQVILDAIEHMTATKVPAKKSNAH